MKRVDELLSMMDQWYNQDQNATIPISLFKTKQSTQLVGLSVFPNLSKVHLSPIHDDHIALSGICFTHKQDNLSFVFVLYRTIKCFLIICFIDLLTSVLFKDLYQSTTVTFLVFPFLHKDQLSHVLIFCKYNSLAVSRRYSLQYLLKTDLFN